jgi:hypothetical protein
MESLSVEGTGWQVSSGRWAGGGSNTLAGQRMDTWGSVLVLLWISRPLCFFHKAFSMVSAHALFRKDCNLEEIERWCVYCWMWFRIVCSELACFCCLKR